MEKLALAGYQRNETVQETGEFAVRGGIVDILVLMASAVRVDFFGDEIDQIESWTYYPSAAKRNYSSLRYHQLWKRR